MKTFSLKFQTVLIVAAVIGFAAATFVAFTQPQAANANPSAFMLSTASSSSNSVVATTSVTWQTAGAATSTVEINGTQGNSFGLSTATLILHRLAAGALSKTKIDFEFSQNCTATVPDWYANATTSAGTVTTGTAGLTWQFASSTTGGIGGPSDRDTIAIQISNVPTQCVRAILSVPAGSASSSVWAEFIGKKEVQ